MPPSGQTIAAVSTGDVSLTDHDIAACKSFHVVTDSLNHAGKLMTNRHRNRNGFLRPVIPVIDVHVCAADRCFQHPDQNIITADCWNRNLLEPKTRLALWLSQLLSSFFARHDTRPISKTRKGVYNSESNLVAQKGRLPRLFP